MLICLSPEELVQQSELNISEFTKGALDFEGTESWEYCTPVSRAAYRIQASVESIYAAFAQSTKKADRIDDIILIWHLMVGLCEAALKDMVVLQEKFPACIDGSFYDRLLEYRTAAAERLHRASEEKEWKNKIPPGLFSTKR